MKLLILFATVLAITYAQQLNQPIQYAPTPYSFNYLAEGDEGTSGHQESGDGAGRVQGSYTVTDQDGRNRVVEYTADENGFRAVVRTNEPGTDNSAPADVVFESTSPDAKGPILQYTNDGAQRPLTRYNTEALPRPSYRYGGQGAYNPNYRYGNQGAYYGNQPTYNRYGNPAAYNPNYGYGNQAGLNYGYGNAGGLLRPAVQGQGQPQNSRYVLAPSNDPQAAAAAAQN